MKLNFEVARASLDESPREMRSRLPVHIVLTVYEGRNTHEVVLRIPKFMAHRIIDIMRFEIDNRT